MKQCLRIIVFLAIFHKGFTIKPLSEVLKGIPKDKLQEVLAEINDEYDEEEATIKPQATTSEPLVTTTNNLQDKTKLYGFTMLPSEDILEETSNETILDAVLSQTTYADKILQASMETNKTTVLHYQSPLSTTMKPQDKDPDDTLPDAVLSKTNYTDEILHDSMELNKTTVLYYQLPLTTTMKPQNKGPGVILPEAALSQTNYEDEILFASMELRQYQSPLTTTMKPQDKELDHLPEPEYYMDPAYEYNEPEILTTGELKRLRNDYLDKMPDFSDPKLRISEIKCKEYIWGAMERDEEALLNVIGGRDANPTEFPHMAAIGWATGTRPRWTFKCGGTLISNKFVLTAAHCTKTSKRDNTVSDVVPKIVRLGVVRVDIAASSAVHDYYIKKIIVHPLYKPPKQYHDIALMELKDAIPLFRRNVHPACLWTSNDTSSLGKKAFVTGWGVIKTGLQLSTQVSPSLQVGDVEIIESEKCHDLLLPWCNRKQCGIKDHQICAGVLAGGVDACQGDSGGPLQVRINYYNITSTNEHIYYVIGVTSFGIRCALENSPGVYTRVSSFIDWIEDIVWPQ